jgi:hypothetical protein
MFTRGYFPIAFQNNPVTYHKVWPSKPQGPLCWDHIPLMARFLSPESPFKSHQLQIHLITKYYHNNGWRYIPYICIHYFFLNKPKEYPQQRETKTVAKHAMNEVCLLPRPFYSRGRACKLQSRHKHCMKKTFFQKRLRYCGQHARSSCKGFSSQRTAVRLTLHFIYLTYIIHIFFVLYITYIFYTIF